MRRHQVYLQQIFFCDYIARCLPFLFLSCIFRYLYTLASEVPPAPYKYACFNFRVDLAALLNQGEDLQKAAINARLARSAGLNEVSSSSTCHI